MTIQDIVSQIDELTDDGVVFAAKIDGQFQATSNAVLLILTEDEIYLPTIEIVRLKCPGLDYFLEVSIIKETVEDLIKATPSISLGQKTRRVIQYAEFDA